MEGRRVHCFKLDRIWITLNVHWCLDQKKRRNSELGITCNYALMLKLQNFLLTKCRHLTLLARIQERRGARVARPPSALSWVYEKGLKVSKLQQFFSSELVV